MIDEIGCYELKGEVLYNVSIELLQLSLPLIITTKNEYLPAVIKNGILILRLFFINLNLVSRKKLRLRLKG